MDGVGEWTTTVSAVLAPMQPDSGGWQFFVCASPQVALDGQYTIFGRVVEGLEVVQAISNAAADGEGRLTERIEIRSVTISGRYTLCVTTPGGMPASSVSSASLLAVSGVSSEGFATSRARTMTPCGSFVSCRSRARALFTSADGVAGASPRPAGTMRAAAEKSRRAESV